MKRHAESISHNYAIECTLVTLKKVMKFHVFASSPLSAIAEIHNLMQNTHHWNPKDYKVSRVKREGLSEYELAPDMTNPDVKHRKRGEQPRQITTEMFPVTELKGRPSDTPIFAPAGETPAASSDAQL